MAVTSIKTGSSFTNLIKYNDFLGPNAAYIPSDFESIATATGTGSNDSVTFSSIPQTYKHLQLRISVTASLGTQAFIELNSDTGSNYARHRFRGDGSAVAVLGQANMPPVEFGMTGDFTTYSSSILAATILDIVDYSSTSKFTTLRSFTGLDVNGAGGRVEMHSGLWQNTDAISTIKIYSGTGRLFSSSSVFSLYGIKG